MGEAGASVAKTASLTVQQWGNSLAVRIPAAVARSARFVVGQPVELSVGEDGVLVKPAGTPKLTLTQKLAAFDPTRHNGEAMAARPVGKEVL
jgi:antitoxin MazE